MNAWPYSPSNSCNTKSFVDPAISAGPYTALLHASLATLSAGSAGLACHFHWFADHL